MTELQSCKRAKLLLTEMHTPYIVCVCVHTAVVGRTTVTWRGHKGHTTVTHMSHRQSHNCYRERSQGSHRGRKIIEKIFTTTLPG